MGTNVIEQQKKEKKREFSPPQYYIVSSFLKAKIFGILSVDLYLEFISEYNGG